jgi:hypothetical protein
VNDYEDFSFQFFANLTSMRTEGSKKYLSPLVIKGYKFFNSVTGENVIIKGIDYYPRPNSGKLDRNSVDLFTNEHRHIWERDIAHFRDLGVNAVRLYSVDPTYDHSDFMCALNAANIYVMVELASQDCAILEKEVPACYPNQLKTRGQAIIKEFSRYTNTLAFSAGNEVNHYVPNGEGPEWNAPCLKKFIKDMRTYVNNCPTMRKIPIGLISADTDRDLNALYYNCQSDPENDLDRAEWYGINSYVVCNGTVQSYDEALGYQLLLSTFQSFNYSIPVLLTEYGCLSQTFPTIDGYEGQRTFHESEWFGLPEVRDVFSGGFVFEYSIEANNAHTPFPYKVFGHQNFGVGKVIYSDPMRHSDPLTFESVTLGYLSPEHCDDLKIPCKFERTPSFYNLESAYAKLSPDPTISLDSFVVDYQRLSASVCPKNFPTLNSIRWTTDNIPDLKCPPTDLYDVCNVVQVKSLFLFSVRVAPIIIILFAAIVFCMKRFILERRKMIKQHHKIMGFKDGESDTFVSSSMSIEKTNYQSVSTHEAN